MNLFLSCIFSHGDYLRERQPDGAYILRCQDCGDVKAILPGQQFTARKVKKPRRVKAQSAEVLHLAKRKVG